MPGPEPEGSSPTSRASPHLLASPLGSGGGGGGGAADDSDVDVSSAVAAGQRLFDALDTEGAGILSLRQLLAALAPTPDPPAAVRDALAELVLELIPE